MVEIGSQPQGADWTPLQISILKYLKESRPRLAKNAPHNYAEWAKSKEIAEAIGEEVKGTNEAIRKAVQLLNIGHKEPVIGGSKGYKYSSSPYEIRKYASDLKQRAEIEVMRANILLSIADKIEASP